MRAWTDLTNSRLLAGYHLRSQIGQHLTTREKAISTAVTKYNTAAKALSPPRPPVSAASILKKTHLGEFDLLRESREEIQSKPWADPTTRVLIDQYFRFTRAKEEVVRLNIEMRRMRTWIRDYEVNLKTAIERITPNDPDLAYEVSRCLRHRQLLHIRIDKQLKEVESYVGFTGLKTMGEASRPLPSPTTFPPTTPVVPPVPSIPQPALAADTMVVDNDDEDRLSDHSLADDQQDVLDRIDTELHDRRAVS